MAGIAAMAQATLKNRVLINAIQAKSIAKKLGFSTAGIAAIALAPNNIAMLCYPFSMP